MSMNWLTAAEPRPKLLVLPPAAADLGEAEAAIELWEHYSRKTLDDTQRLVVQVMMAQTAAGRWAASTTGREMPRQNGKGDEIEVVELWGLVQRAEAILHTVHDAVLLASQTQQRMLGVLESHGDLRRLVKRKWQGTGQQMIEMRNGGVIWYRTRTGGGGRGVDDIDRLVVDEAQHATEEQLAAVSPTLLANPNPQLNAMGTAGLDGISRWWWSVRKRALSADPGAFGYVGHTAENVYLDAKGRVVQEPVDAAYRTQWGPCNPAAASGRGGGMEFLEEQFRRLPDSFAQEHLGVWGAPPSEDDEAAWEVISEVRWKATGATPAEPEGWMLDPVSLGIEVAPDFSWASIGAAGDCRDGGDAVELVEHRPGTAWLVARAAKLATDHKPKTVVIDPRSPAAAFIEALTAAGVTVVEPKTAEVVRAAGALYVGVEQGGVVHLATDDQVPLDEAVASAAKRTVSDAWVWQASPTAAPLRAVTLALLGHRRPPESDPDSVYESRGLVVL